MARKRRQQQLPGIFTLYSIRNGVWTPQASGPNIRMHSAAWIFAQALTSPNSGIWLNTMYIEFENVANPEDAVVAPTINRNDGVEYYAGLTGARDYLRILMDRPPIVTIASGYEDAFQPGQGNVVKFYAATTGTAGVNGEPFGGAYNSKIYGAAIAAAPVPSDPTRDILYARKYYPTESQQVVAASGQVGVSYRQPFYDE